MPGSKPVICEEMSNLDPAAAAAVHASDLTSLENIGESWRNLEQQGSSATVSTAPGQNAEKNLNISTGQHMVTSAHEKSNHTFTTSEGEDGLDLDFKSNGVRPRWIGARKFTALVFLVIVLAAAMLALYTFSSSSPTHLHVADSTSQLARRRRGATNAVPSSQARTTPSTAAYHDQGRHLPASTPQRPRRASASPASSQAPSAAPPLASAPPPAPTAAQAATARAATAQAAAQQQQQQQLKEQQQQQQQARAARARLSPPSPPLPSVPSCEAYRTALVTPRRPAMLQQTGNAADGEAPPQGSRIDGTINAWTAPLTHQGRDCRNDGVLGTLTTHYQRN